MLGTFIDTIIICSLALVIVISGAWKSGDNGAVLASNTLFMAFPNRRSIITISLILFAFVTIIGWVITEKDVLHIYLEQK